MIPLHRKQFPSSKSELAEALDGALRRYVQKQDPMVAIYSRVFPYLDEIAVNLDGARIDSLPPGSPSLVGDSKPAFEAAVLNFSGRAITLHQVSFDIRVAARDLVFARGSDEKDNALLIIQRVRDGTGTLSATQLDLENHILEVARREGRKHGIIIEQVRLAMRARGPRSIAADVRVQARKFLLRARLDIYGQLDIDSSFAAKISELRCKGDGTVGSLACNALNPLFEKLKGKTFPLSLLLPGEVRLRDVRVTVADTIGITVDFGEG